MKKLSEKRIIIGNAINVELIEKVEHAKRFLGHLDSKAIDSFEEHFMKNEVIKHFKFGKRIVREHIVQLILEEFGVEAFGTKPVLEQNERKHSESSSSRWKN